jgi:RNA polymerase sigma-70 factor (ECF subfamily)
LSPEETCASAEWLIAQRVAVEEQITELFENQRDRIYRYLVTLIAEPGAAEEITQEVFLRLYEQLIKGRRVDNLRAWSYAVAHNLAIDFVRGQRLSTSGDEVLWSQVAETRADGALNPEEQVLNSERLTCFRTSLESLPVQQRACLLLRAEGLRYREIAKVLGVGIPTVGESLRRAVVRLMRGHRDESAVSR